MTYTLPIQLRGPNEAPSITDKDQTRYFTEDEAFGPPSVVLTGGGGSSGAAEVALNDRNVGQPGTVHSITVTNGGSGYTSTPTVTITSEGSGGLAGTGIKGSGATATATVVDCVITAITVTNAGSNYAVPPTVTITGGSGSSATATANLTGSSINTVSVTNAGSGYTTAPTVTFKNSVGAPLIWGHNAVATAILLSRGVASIAVTNGGSGYTCDPTVTITGGGGVGATATASESGGVVTSITVTNSGSGYTSAPTITIVGDGSSATATATLQSAGINTITVSDGGAGYTAGFMNWNPAIVDDNYHEDLTVSFTVNSPGAGEVTLSADAVSGVIINWSDPTLSLAAGNRASLDTAIKNVRISRPSLDFATTYTITVTVNDGTLSTTGTVTMTALDIARGGLIASTSAVEVAMIRNTRAFIGGNTIASTSTLSLPTFLKVKQVSATIASDSAVALSNIIRTIGLAATTISTTTMSGPLRGRVPLSGTVASTSTFEFPTLEPIIGLNATIASTSITNGTLYQEKDLASASAELVALTGTTDDLSSLSVDLTGTRIALAEDVDNNAHIIIYNGSSWSTEQTLTHGTGTSRLNRHSLNRTGDVLLYGEGSYGLWTRSGTTWTEDTSTSSGHPNSYGELSGQTSDSKIKLYFGDTTNGLKIFDNDTSEGGQWAGNASIFTGTDITYMADNHLACISGDEMRIAVARVTSGSGDTSVGNVGIFSRSRADWISEETHYGGSDFGEPAGHNLLEYDDFGLSDNTIQIKDMVFDDTGDRIMLCITVFEDAATDVFHTRYLIMAKDEADTYQLEKDFYNTSSTTDYIEVGEVSLSKDGDKAKIFYNDESSKGVVRNFSRDGFGWHTEDYLTLPALTGSDTYFFDSSNDGTLVAIGETSNTYGVWILRNM